MDFALSETQRDVVDLARRLFDDHCTPERLRHLERSAQPFDCELWRQLAEAGLLGLSTPEAYGGMGLDFEHQGLLMNEIGRRVAPVPLWGHSLATHALLAGAAAPRERWLADAVGGRALLTTAWLEPGDDTPEPALTRARPEGDGWCLDGDKHCVPYGEQADAVVLAAQSDQGLLWLVVDARAAGVSWSTQYATSGEPQAAMALRGVRVGADALVAGPRAAPALQRDLLQRARALLCCQACGLVQEMLALTVVYTSQREQFGRALASFQAVGQRAADCYIDNECLRLVTQQAVSRLSREQDAAREVLIAKVWCGDVCHRVSQAAQHLHGGMGVDRDYPLHRYCLWARQLELTLGPSGGLLAELGDRLAAA